MKTLSSAYKFHAPYTCSCCGAEVRRKEIIAGRAKEIDETTCICPGCLSNPGPKGSKTASQPASGSKNEPRSAPVAENEDFVVMIAAAMEDSMVRDKILFLAQLSSFHRESLINSVITELRLNGKASSLVSAIECLKNDQVAQRTIEVLTSK